MEFVYGRIKKMDFSKKKHSVNFLNSFFTITSIFQRLMIRKPVTPSRPECILSAYAIYLANNTTYHIMCESV